FYYEDENVGKQLKIVFLGESSVGKTSIIRRFCYDEFTRQYNQTIGADFYIRRLVLPGRHEVTVRITDVGGFEFHGHMLANYLFNSNLIILVYDITNSVSFDCLPLWIDAIKRIIDNPPICAIIGNKCDLEHQRAVRLDKTKHFLQDYRLYNFLLSAKTGEAVNSSLMDLIAKHFKIPLTRIEKEHQESIVKVELIPASAGQNRPSGVAASTSSVCCVQ
ncbi:ras-related protein Rab-28-like, partial [Zophobas morio]|uniref:ras-related protein Rab-28-like n=1 Tax=Zophobas morio TaxID=2755281 RepID=UPI003082DF1F